MKWGVLIGLSLDERSALAQDVIVRGGPARALAPPEEVPMSTAVQTDVQTAPPAAPRTVPAAAPQAAPPAAPERPDEPVPGTPANPRSRVVLATLGGTTVEFYDFYVYSTAAVLVFPHLFFPTGNETTSLLSSFAVFGAAMVARPLGAVFFGHLGDKHGRKATLVGALLTMGIATFLIGLLRPTPRRAGSPPCCS